MINVLKITVSATLIIYLLHSANLQEMARLITGASPLLLLGALLVYLGAITVGNLKWSVLVRALELRSSFFDLLTYSFAGLFFGNVLPTNIGGDLVRAYYLAHDSGDMEQSVTSVLIDRLVGLSAFLAAAVIMSIVATATLTTNLELETIVLATVIVFSVVIAAFTLLLSRRAMLKLAFVFDIRLLRPFKPMAQRVFNALQVYRHNYTALLQGFVLSLLVVVLTAVTEWMISLALGLDVSLFYFMLFNPLIAFVLLVPLSINGLGLKELSFVFFLGLVGVPAAAALSISLVFHAIIVISSLPGGLVWFRNRTPEAMIAEASGKAES